MLCHDDQAKFGALPDDVRQGVGEPCRPHDEALRATGRLLMVCSLQPPQSGAA